MPIVPVWLATVRTGMAGLTMIVTVAAAEVPAALVAVMPKADVPAVVGVPLIDPVAVFRVSPACRVPLAIA